ncbi:MAG TPA: heavy metal-binding domain-containing protein [Blastocatellia bacterium]|nr:heavy metal-binding domain-containing protein [Blastocatellia bacterium]
MRVVLFVIFSLIVSPAFFHTHSSAYQEKVTYTCVMDPDVQSSKPGLCAKCGMRLIVKKSQSTNPAPANQPAATTQPAVTITQSREVLPQGDTYTCVMHPEIRSAVQGKCPKCEMTLVPVNPEIAEEFDLKLESLPKMPEPGKNVKLRFAIFNPKTGETVKQFYLQHDKLFHLFIVSQDMQEFQHIHPTFEPDGAFTIETVLPRPGQYKVYSDFYPERGAPQVLQRNLVTAGFKSDLAASQARLTADTSFSKTVDGIKIDLKIEPSQIIAGQPATLKYHLTDAKTGEPIRDIVPYLGAWGHTLILSEDQSDYVHSHPEETVSETADRTKLRGGPDVTFGAFLPREGNYRIWTQFQRGDKLTTVSFTVRAERLR